MDILEVIRGKKRRVSLHVHDLEEIYGMYITHLITYTEPGFQSFNFLKMDELLNKGNTPFTLASIKKHPNNILLVQQKNH